MRLWNSVKRIFGGHDRVMGFDPTDADLQTSKVQARETLSEFWRSYEVHAAYGDYMLKVALPTTGSGVEHIWVESITRKDGRLSGQLVNRPAYTRDPVQEGDWISFTEDQISDWTYRKDGLFLGQYMTRLMLMHPERDGFTLEAAAAMEASLSKNPIED